MLCFCFVYLRAAFNGACVYGLSILDCHSDFSNVYLPLLPRLVYYILKLFRQCGIFVFISILLHVPKGELHLPWQLLTCCLKRSNISICPVFFSTLINPKSQLVLGLLNRSDRMSLLFSGFVIFSCTSSCSLIVMICRSKSMSRTVPISRLITM